MGLIDGLFRFDSEPCQPNPDIAGIGVVSSFITAAVLTTAASCYAAYLDLVLLDEELSAAPKAVRWLNPKQDDSTRKRRIFQRKIIDKTILALADQQLIGGFALLLTGFITLPPNDWYKAHFALIVFLSCLSSSSHLAAIITLRKYFHDDRSMAILRIVAMTLFAISLVVSTAISEVWGPFYYPIFLLLEPITTLIDPVGFVLQPTAIGIVPIVWCFWTAIMQILPHERERFRAWLRRHWWPGLRRYSGLGLMWRLTKRHCPERVCRRAKKGFFAFIKFILFSSVLGVFLSQTLFATISLIAACIQKFAVSAEADTCTLNSSEENEMGYGQVLALMMLLLPALSLFESYHDQMKAKRRDEAREGLRPLLRSSQNTAYASTGDGSLSLETLLTASPTRVDDAGGGPESPAAFVGQTQQPLEDQPRRMDTEMAIGLPTDTASTSALTDSEHIVQGVTRRGTS